MTQYVQIAWRNLWRNKRRTLITVASVFFALLLALFMRSMQVGTYEMMEHDSVKNTTGYLQVQAKGYWDDKTINNTFENSQGLVDTLMEIQGITCLTPRLESFALLSSGNMTKGVAIIGTDPAIEDSMTGLKNRIIRGTYFSSDSNSILVGEVLARYLKVDTGDTLILLSQGYHGITAAGEFIIQGIFRFPAPMMNSEVAYLKLQDAQYFYAAPNRLTSLSVMIDDPDMLEDLRETITDKTRGKYAVLTWKEMLVALVQSIESDNISGWFMLGILYLVVAFGIFGTMLMMTMERKREFAVMVSVGMQRYKLTRIILLETFFIGLLGIIVAFLISLPVINYLHHHPIPLTGAAAEAMLEMNARPILPFSLDPELFINQIIVIGILTLLAVVFPVYYVNKFNILRAFRGK
ncbi:MAG: FtsX-like permease family protein [Bacteroidetes bacterium]|nr:FtsX-like permease family protein [Bacteroidota bacterium]